MVLFDVNVYVFSVALWRAWAFVMMSCCPENFNRGDNAPDPENPEYYSRKNSEKLRKKDYQQAKADED